MCGLNFWPSGGRPARTTADSTLSCRCRRAGDFSMPAQITRTLPPLPKWPTPPRLREKRGARTPASEASMSCETPPSTSPMKRSVTCKFSGGTQRTLGRPEHSRLSWKRTSSGSAMPTKRRMGAFAKAGTPRRPGDRSSRAGVSIYLVDGVDAVQNLLRQFYFAAGDIGLELFHRRGADDVGRNERPAGDEGQGHLGRIEAAGARQLHILRRGGYAAGRLIALELFVEGEAGAGGPGAVYVLAGEQAHGERRICQQAALLARCHLGEADLEAAVHEAVGILDADHARPASGLGQFQIVHRAPGGLVGQANLPRLSALHDIGEHRERLFE